ncbi:MAG: DUF1131 domain-containing protein [Caulobacteraceae bacterium]|nr:DUF1131 domain-containing protein [Caulobacteraceae bacterium]
MIRSLAPSVLALALLAACGEPAAPPPPLDAPAERPPPPVTVAPAPAAPPAEPWTSGELKVTPGGVGPLSAATPFEREAVLALFPEARVEPGFLHFGDKTWPQIAVEQGDALGLSIIETSPGHREVRISAGQAVGPNGEALMARWADAKFDPADCEAGIGRDVGAIVCRRPDTPQISYIFGVPGWTQSTIPPAATLAEKAFIREIVWTPPAGAPVVQPPPAAPVKPPPPAKAAQPPSA